MDDFYIEELARKMFDEMYQFWTKDERQKQWERDDWTRLHYRRLAETAMNYFHSIYYQL